MYTIDEIRFNKYIYKYAPFALSMIPFSLVNCFQPQYSNILDPFENPWVHLYLFEDKKSNAAASSICVSPPTSGLVLHLPFNGGASDQSGNFNNGTVFGATPISDRKNNANNAYQFINPTDYIIVNDAPSLRLPDAGSWSLWVWVDPAINYSISGGPHFFSKGATFGALFSDYAFSIASAFYRMEITDGSNVPNYVTSSVTFPTSVWKHLVVTYSGSEIKIFIDKKLMYSGSVYSAARQSTQSLYLGHRYTTNNSGAFLGYLDDFRIYNYALNDLEISALFCE